MASDEHDGSEREREETQPERGAAPDGAEAAPEEPGRARGPGTRRGRRGLVALAAAALSTPAVGTAAEPAGRGDAARGGQPAATGTPESEKPAAERSRGLVWKGKEVETDRPGADAGERGIKIRPESAPSGRDPQAINPVMGPSRGEEAPGRPRAIQPVMGPSKGDDAPGSPQAIQPVMGPSKGAEGPESPRAIQPVMGPSKGDDAPGSPQAIQPVMGPAKRQPLEGDVVEPMEGEIVEPPEGDTTQK
jgi:hypothetical protein